MKIIIRLVKRLKKIIIPLSVIAMIITIITGTIGICDRAKLYFSSRNESKESKSTSEIIQIKRGETKIIFEDNLLQITIDNILQIDETNLYRMSGKIDNGISTNIFEKTQGESLRFDDFIIQISRIASDYAEFRVSFNNDY